LLAIVEAIRREKSFGWLVAAALAASSCFFVRYIGVVVVATGCVAIFMAGRPQVPARRRMTRAAAFAAVAAAGPVAWIVRNLSVSDTVTGERAPPDLSFVENVEDAARGIGGLVAPLALASPLRVFLLVMVATAMAAAVLRIRAQAD
jgi:hypothetical protein